MPRRSRVCALRPYSDSAHAGVLSPITEKTYRHENAFELNDGKLTVLPYMFNKGPRTRVVLSVASENRDKRCSNIATACAKRVTEAQHRETSPRKAWRPDEGTEMVYARGTLLRRLFMDRFIQSDFGTWCSSPIAWQLRVQVDQCWTLEECDGCRVYRSPRSRVLARSTQKSPVFPSNADCEHWK